MMLDWEYTPWFKTKGKKKDRERAVDIYVRCFFKPILALDVDTEAPDYDLDSEDEEWVNSQSEKQVT